MPIVHSTVRMDGSYYSPKGLAILATELCRHVHHPHTPVTGYADDAHAHELASSG